MEKETRPDQIQPPVLDTKDRTQHAEGRAGEPCPAEYGVHGVPLLVAGYPEKPTEGDQPD